MKEGGTAGSRPFLLRTPIGERLIDLPSSANSVQLERAEDRFNGADVTPQGREIWDGVKLAVIAVVCALFTATLVIGIGGAVLRSEKTSGDSTAGPEQPPMATELF